MDKQELLDLMLTNDTRTIFSELIDRIIILENRVGITEERNNKQLISDLKKMYEAHGFTPAESSGKAYRDVQNKHTLESARQKLLTKYRDVQNKHTLESAKQKLLTK